MPLLPLEFLRHILVWDAVQNKIPFLREQILRILREENAL
jgi:uncharacterized protein with HEPN domain